MNGSDLPLAVAGAMASMVQTAVIDRVDASRFGQDDLAARLLAFEVLVSNVKVELMKLKGRWAQLRRWWWQFQKNFQLEVLGALIEGWDRETEAWTATRKLLLLVGLTLSALLSVLFAIHHARQPLADNAGIFLLRDMLSSGWMVFSLLAILLLSPTINAVVQSLPGKVALFFVTTGVVIWAKALTASMLASVFPMPTASLPWAMLLGTVYSSAGLIAIGLVYSALVLECIALGPLLWGVGRARNPAKRGVMLVCCVLTVAMMASAGMAMKSYLGERGRFITAVAAFGIDFTSNHKCAARKGEVVAFLGDGAEKAMAVTAPNLSDMSLGTLRELRLLDRLPKPSEFHPVACNRVDK